MSRFAAPLKNLWPDYFYKIRNSDELLFIHKDRGFENACWEK